MLKHSRLSRVSHKRTFFHRGQYLSKLSPLLYLGVTIALGMYFQSFESKNIHVFNPRADVHFVSPLVVGPVYAMEEIEHLPVVTPTPEPVVEKPKTQTEEIEAYIEEVFGVYAEQAKTIAKCESGFQEKVVGDKKLMVKYQGEIVGDSIGVFQIRTGGRDFNRAKANGMTADEFRTHLKDYKNNIDYAKKIFDRGGWGPWTCKKDLK